MRIRIFLKKNNTPVRAFRFLNYTLQRKSNNPRKIKGIGTFLNRLTYPQYSRGSRSVHRAPQKGLGASRVDGRQPEEPECRGAEGRSMLRVGGPVVARGGGDNHRHFGARFLADSLFHAGKYPKGLGEWLV